MTKTDVKTDLSAIRTRIKNAEALRARLDALYDQLRDAANWVHSQDDTPCTNGVIDLIDNSIDVLVEQMDGLVKETGALHQQLVVAMGGGGD